MSDKWRWAVENLIPELNQNNPNVGITYFATYQSFTESFTRLQQ